MWLVPLFHHGPRWLKAERNARSSVSPAFIRLLARVLARIATLAQTHQHAVLPASLLGKAIHYLLGQWPKLIRYLDNGLYPIDNNVCENAIRPFVIGRRNWLFADTVGGATASANLYSLIETAKANGVEPFCFLRALFTELPKARSADDYAALLPWRDSPLVAKL